MGKKKKKTESVLKSRDALHFAPRPIRLRRRTEFFVPTEGRRKPIGVERETVTITARDIEHADDLRVS